MALLHGTAELVPSKRELLADWMPNQPWFHGGEIKSLGSFRFDDPDGEVGMESIILTADGRTYQAAMTYRAAPLDGGRLIGTMDHSVLGPRWAYDATSDPVFAAALGTTILAGGTQAPLVRDTGTKTVSVDPVVTVKGSGVPGAEIETIELRGSAVTDEGTLMETSGPNLVLIHDLEAGAKTMGDHRLTGEWEGSPSVLLAVARLR